MGLLDRFRDWTRAHDLAEAFLYMLERERGTGRGIGVPISDPTYGEINARAVDILKKKHPEIIVTVWQADLMLSFREDMQALRGGDLERVLPAIEAKEGDDLVARTEKNREIVQADPFLVDRPRWAGALDGRDPATLTEKEKSDFNNEQVEWELEAEKRRAADRERGVGAVAGRDGIPTSVNIYNHEGKPIGGAMEEAPQATVVGAIRDLRSRLKNLIGKKQ